MPSPATTRPEVNEHSGQMGKYVQLVPPGDLTTILSRQIEALQALVGDLNDQQVLALHPPYTWSIKQVVAHLTDCERVFGYRALRLARNDVTPLPGFDENAYMQFSDPDRIPLADLLAEFALVRRSHVLMLRHLADDAWKRQAIVNGHMTSVRAMGCVMAGHVQHHLSILCKRLGR